MPLNKQNKTKQTLVSLKWQPGEIEIKSCSCFFTLFQFPVVRNKEKEEEKRKKKKERRRKKNDRKKKKERREK